MGRPDRVLYSHIVAHKFSTNQNGESMEKCKTSSNHSPVRFDVSICPPQRGSQQRCQFRITNQLINNIAGVITDCMPIITHLRFLSDQFVFDICATCPRISALIIHFVSVRVWPPSFPQGNTLPSLRCSIAKSMQNDILVSPIERST